GRGLPQDTTAARFQGSKVLGSPIGGDIDSLLGLLEDVDNPKFDNMVALPPELVLSKDQKQRNSQVAKLEKVIRSGSYEARRIAVQNLARAQGMDSVPILIFALSDPDETVMKAARDALRFVSRKINGFGLPDKATDPERARAQQNWRNWYRSVRPDVKLD
ncbi:MAG: HEAT repeat domain-containing protein, partial [Planctomycetaceae bacterium]|nr:HEAT repeat domain-containing protein [Planctomycetaceae bacterium]